MSRATSTMIHRHEQDNVLPRTLRLESPLRDSSGFRTTARGFGAAFLLSVVAILAFFYVGGFSHLPSTSREHNKKVSCPSVRGSKAIGEEKLSLVHPQSCLVGDSNSFDSIYYSGAWGVMFNHSFEGFYSNARWPPQFRPSPSGPGSDRGIATETSLAILRQLIVEKNISTMIDVPCGDVNWIFYSYETDSLRLYVGLDIVRPVVEFNQKRFAFHSNKLFYWWDAVNCALPKHSIWGGLQSFDMIHARDVIMHLPLAAGQLFLCHVMFSGARWLVATTFPNATNKEILYGQFYENNLHAEPFSLPKRAGTCKFTHPSIEADMTCIFDLTEHWIWTYKERKCGNTTSI